jgi:hypothetical protein
MEQLFQVTGCHYHAVAARQRRSLPPFNRQFQQFLNRLAIAIRTLQGYNFPQQNAKGMDIGWERIIQMQHDFGSGISRCSATARQFLARWFVRVMISCQAKVQESDLPIAYTKTNIGRFKIYPGSIVVVVVVVSTYMDATSGESVDKEGAI